MSDYSDNYPGNHQSTFSNSSSGTYSDRFRVDSSEPPRHLKTPKPTSAVLSSLIERACSPHLLEPNLALNLEITDIINQKKGTAPRIAAINIVKLINSKSAHIAILALGVLDICVKNCGYPFHLQISRKEFLNELVRRFPEKPPISYSRVQNLILQQIQEWWETICSTSKYKDDLAYIRDMHRLLSFKGYIFPEISVSDAAVLNPTENLQSAAELEQEERDAQEAKLQELIRRGTPADLQEANRLMKVMAGFQTKGVTDYHAKAAEEIDKLRRKSELLEDMLNNIKEGDSVQDDDVFSEIVSTLKTSQPKIERIIDEEKDDQEAVVKLLALNDYIHSLLEKYSLFKQKNFQGALNVKITKNARSPSSTPKPSTSLSLIDFDDASSDSPAPSTSSAPPLNLLDQLNGLSFSPPSATIPTTSAPFSTVGLFSGATQPVATPPVAAASAASTSSPGPSTPDYNSLRALSPSHNNTNDLLGSSSDWNFSSAPAPPPITAPNKISISSDGLDITLEITRDTPSCVQIKALFSNTLPTQTLSNLNFQLAVPRSFSLRMEPQSHTILGPATQNAITQVSRIDGATKGAALKLRWRVSGMLGATVYERDGVIDSFPDV